MIDDKPAKTSDDDAIIAECKKRLAQSMDADAENRAEGMDDLRFLSGKGQWSDGARAQRDAEGRPCLTINKLPAVLRQITNSNRRNVPSIIVHPANNAEASRKRAEVIQGAIRHVEYASQAHVAYDTAVASAAAIGVGYFRLVTRYVNDNTFDQEIAFERIRNTFTVALDPADDSLDGSKATWGVISAMLPRADFKARYPDAEPCNFEAGIDAAWVTDAEVRVAEYYRIQYVPAVVCQLSDGTSGYKDDLGTLPIGVAITKERKSNKKQVQWFRISGTEVLERADIPSKYIPIFPVYGDELDIDGRVQRSGMVRHAKDPARFYNFWITSATEEVALRPKTPYIGAEGQFDGHEEKWNTAGKRNHPYLEYQPVALGGMLAPPPMRQPMADLPAGVLQMAAMAGDDIKATTGIYDASMGARSNETSGRAIMARDKQGETANSHFIDNLHATLRHVARVIMDMWPTVYDGTRTLSIMGEDGKVTAEDVNVPGMGDAVKELYLGMDTAGMTVTVRAGPGYDTLRQEAVEGMIGLSQSWPRLMEVAGDKIVRHMDWPGADQIADRIAKTLPPELRDEEDQPKEQMIETPQGPMPAAQVGPMLAQMQQQMQDMGQALQEAQQTDRKLQADYAKAEMVAQTSIRVAEINATSKQDVEELKGYISLLTAQQAQAESQLAGMQQAALQRQDVPEPAPAPDQRADEVRGMLEQLLAAQSAPPARRGRQTITAPSGAVYVVDDEQIEQPATEEVAPEGEY